MFPRLQINEECMKVWKIKHPAASYGVLTSLSKLLAIASLRPKERGIEPAEIENRCNAEIP